MGYSDEFNLAHARNFRIPSVKFIADELRAIKQEYDMVSYRTAEGVLSVVMGPFIIKDVNFGRFEIIIDERYLGVLGNGFSEPTLKALTPNHPKSGDGREHPHISLDKYLCMGAGEDIFKSAISEVRILDALSIIESVLNTYGAEPYKPIEAWTGYFCNDCSGYHAEGNMSDCYYCGNQRCNNCTVPDCCQNAHTVCYNCVDRARYSCIDCSIVP